MDQTILVINPGSTSDDIGFFRNGKQEFSKVMRYSPPDLKPFEAKPITAQLEFRKKLLLGFLKENNILPGGISAIIGRGGLVRPIESGTYRVGPKLLEDLRYGVMGDHSSNLGGILAHELGELYKAPAFIADPVVVDELEPMARYSGMPDNPRISIFHALNHKRVARLAARQLGKAYEDCRLIVMHGGGGISVGAHRNGRVVDVNNALDGEGPFTPQRSGGVPSGGLARLCFGGKYTHADMKLKIKGRGGMVAYTGTSDMLALEKYIETGAKDPACGMDYEKISREQALELRNAMAYQIAKEIGAMAAVLEGKVDALVLTGGLAYDKGLVKFITDRVGWIAQVLLFPGGDEKAALCEAAARALENPASAKEYN
ncbi:MAG: butyrate kinase [Elusimicrobia bacterium]|nr:butyrate kinase [Elusimicrobiota bacterium]